MENNSLNNNLLQELKRGTLTLAVLLMVKKSAYGYALVTRMREAGIDVEQNTLYPLLRRLESQGFLKSAWNTDENRPRKYYSVTKQGEKTAAMLLSEWRRTNAIISKMTRTEA